MKKIISIIILLIMLVVLLANPAPVSIEFADLILISLPCILAILAISTIRNFKLSRIESNLLIAIFLYLTYLLCSIIVGIMHNVPMLNTLRSIGPYLNFFPILFLGFLPSRFLNPWMMAFIFILIGSFQASYQIYLFFTHSYGELNTLDVLRSRITLIEPRTTLPIVLSVTILPMAIFTFNNTYLKLLAIATILFGFLAGAATLTRSVIISIVIGWLSFGILYLYQMSRSNTFSSVRLLKQFGIYLVLFVIGASFISLIPKINLLEQGIISRFYYDSSSNVTTDYSNGRLYDEWLPALKTWMNAGIPELFFGIGSGNSFTVITGEERTYIHNLTIYSLVYGGFYGLFCCLWLYFSILKTLVIRSLQSNQIIYLGFAALLISLFSYAQLFAVHKGLAFNAMLFLIATLALCKPDKLIN